VFLNRLGEIRDRSFENQRYRASGLNLVVAAIILWNTVLPGTGSPGAARLGQEHRSSGCYRIFRRWAGSTST
jgi:hypothetical protein